MARVSAAAQVEPPQNDGARGGLETDLWGPGGGGESLVAMALRAFPSVDHGEFAEFLAGGDITELDSGERIVSPGTRPPGLCFVVSGCAVIEQDGHILREFQTGSYFGEGGLYRDEPPQVAIRSHGRTRVLVLPYETVQTFLEERPSFGLAFTSALVREGMARLAATNHLYADNRALALDLESKATALEEANEKLLREAIERKRIEAQNASLARLADECPTPIMRADADGRLLYVNMPSQPLLSAWRTNVGRSVPPELKHEIATALADDEQQPRNMELLVQDSSYVFTTVPIRESGYVNLYGRDITADRRKEARILHLATHDSLTGLPNRASFLERLRHCLSAVETEGGGALMFLDLDHFKEVNDTLGHQVGDRLLQAVTQRLVKCVRGSDLVARLGGDEFATIQTGLIDPTTAASQAQRMINAVARPYVIDGHKIRIGVSIGITFFPADHREAEPLVKNADLAMYRAKTDGRNTHRFYVPNLESDLRDRVELESDLQLALAENQFVLHYQPKMSISTGKLVGAEALVRWNHPRIGMISPDRFVPAAERSGLIVALGRWVLNEACGAAARWPSLGIDPIHIAVNLSPVQVQDARIVEDVAEALAKSGLPASLLELEITEGLLMQEVEQTISKLDALHTLGISLSIDDFGTGYSCLSYLRRFPVAKIKIDRSFVQEMTTSSSAATITRAIIGLSQGLNLTVVAEGVEDQEQLAQLKAFACAEGQGYLFSRPLPVAEFEAFALKR